MFHILEHESYGHSDFTIFNNHFTQETLTVHCFLSYVVFKNLCAILYFLFPDSHPTCSGETKGRVVNASCSIEFSGNWPPVIDWTDATRKTLVADTTTIPNHRVTSFLIVQLSGDPHELYSVACTVKFREAEKPPKTTAKNIPKIPSDICSVPIKAPG